MNNNDFKTTGAVAKQSALDYAEISNTLNTINARVEALSIVVNILNSLLHVIQSSDTPLSPEAVASLQTAINQESAITNNMFTKISGEITSQEVPEDILSESEATEASMPEETETKDA